MYIYTSYRIHFTICAVQFILSHKTQSQSLLKLNCSIEIATLAEKSHKVMVDQAMDSPQQHVYKKGDIVWVIYRGKDFPAKVSAYYPKERKISHIWFPINRKSITQIFKAPLHKVRPFSIDDQLPENADPVLQASYEQAVRILHGATEEDLIAEGERQEEEFAVQKGSAKKKLSAADVLKKTTGGGTPKNTLTPRKNTAQMKQLKTMPVAVNSPKVPYSPAMDQSMHPDHYEPGETIIVDTKIGMWPGIFHSYDKSDPAKIIYTMFPRSTTKEMMSTSKDNIFHFPLEQIEEAIQEGNGSDSLMEALLDALQYVEERNDDEQHMQMQQQQPPSAQKSTSSSKKQTVAAKSTPKTPVQPKEILNNSGKGKKATPIVEPPSQNHINNNNDAATAVPNTKAMAQARLSQKRTLEQRKQAVDSPSSGISSPAMQQVKRRKLTEEEIAAQEKSLALFPPRDKPLILKKSTPIREKLSATTTSSSSNGAGSSATLSPPKSTNGHMSATPPTEPVEEEQPQMRQIKQEILQGHESRQIKQEMLQGHESPEQQQPLPEQHKSVEPPVPPPPTPAVVEKPSTFELASSEQALQHLRKIWASIDEGWYRELVSGEHFAVTFRTGNMLNFNEVEQLVSLLQQWIKIGGYRFPQLTPLRELYYIGNWALPELCAFAISKDKGTPINKARRIFDAAELKNSEESSDANAPNSLDTLVKAATTLMAEQQNGTGGSGGSTGAGEGDGSD